MLYWRTFSEGFRRYCPDVLGGSPGYHPDELPSAEIIEAEVVDVIEAVPVEVRGALPEPDRVEAVGTTVETPTTTNETDEAVLRVVRWCRNGVEGENFDAEKAPRMVTQALKFVAKHHKTPISTDYMTDHWDAMPISDQMLAVVVFYESGELPPRSVSDFDDDDEPALQDNIEEFGNE